MTTTSDKPARKAFRFDRDGKLRPSVEFDLNDQKGIRCVPALDGLTLLGFAELAGSFGEVEEGADISVEDAVKGATAILGLFRNAIVPEDWDRFEKGVRQPDAIVEIEDLSEIAGWLVEQYTDRPTE